jgi:hypothetical protein
MGGGSNAHAILLPVRPMPHDKDSNVEIQAVAEYLLREAEKLKKVCEVYGLITVSMTLEMTMAEARRIMARGPDSKGTEH